MIAPNRFHPLLLLVLVACSSKTDEQAPPVASSAPPAEAMDPNSLVEGEAEIFGMRMPTRTSVNRRTPLGAGAQIPWQFDRVANYFRERLDAESVEVGPRSTIFRHAKIKGDTSGFTYNIVVKRTGHTAEVAFRQEAQLSADASARPEDVASNDETPPLDETPGGPRPSASGPDGPVPPKPTTPAPP